MTSLFNDNENIACESCGKVIMREMLFCSVMTPLNTDTGYLSALETQKLKVYLRVKTTSKYETMFPYFYFSASNNGWYCKTCPNFASGTGLRAFIEKPGGFGDHPGDRVALHLNSKRHMDTVKNKQTYKEVQAKYSSVHTLLKEANIAKQLMNENQNLFVIKSFFRVIHFLIVKKWAYTHNFKDLVDLISQCGGMEVRKHLDFGPRNAQYTSPEYVGKFVTVINDYIELPVLASLQSKCFTFYNDESQDITSTEQMAIYGSFEHNKKVSEHFIGIYPISKLVGTKLSAGNIMHCLKKYFEDASINIKQARFACMDTTNVNSGKKGGLKRYLANKVPLLNWVGCGNHKLALCFKHLLPKYPTVFATDAFLEALWKFFKYRPLAMNLLDQSANIYGEKVVVPVCPSVTRWTAHERACLSVVRGYRQFVSSLVVCYNERREPEAPGLLMQLCKPDTVANILMLLEVFKSTGPLNLILQKGDGSLCLAEIPALLEISIHQLSTSKDDRKWLKEDTFLEMKNVAEEEIVNLPVASRLRESVVFDWSTF